MAQFDERRLVLLVEDDILIALEVSNELQDAGFAVQEETTAEDAIAENKHPDHEHRIN